ncbi:hypothetical protein F4677DRAFT_163094 [Hypoxylon crocopeplum]|nr:hypothetical protein F4677DRAFT_163094 [Hypoxylon crocopeplum]
MSSLSDQVLAGQLEEHIAELADTKAKLAIVELELGAMKFHADNTDSALAVARTEISATRSGLVTMQFKLVTSNSELAAAKTEASKITSELAVAQYRLTNLSDAVAAMEADLASTKAALDRLQLLHAGQQAPRPLPALPDPARLGDLALYDVWHAEMRVKLRVDRRAIGSDEALFIYVFGRLEPPLQKHVVREVEAAEAHGRFDFQRLFWALSNVHGTLSNGVTSNGGNVH